MEKKYIKPEVQIVEIELQPMMAASEQFTISVDNSDENAINPSMGESKSHNIWED